MIANGAEKGTEQGDFNKLPLMTVTDDQYRLLYGALEGNVFIIQKLFLLGVKINAYDYDGRTALGVAASQGNLAVVKYLLAHGADPFHRDIRNNDALADAKRENHAEVVACLESAIRHRMA